MSSAADTALPVSSSPVRDYAFTLFLVLVVLTGTRQDLGFLLPLLSPFLLAWVLRLLWIAARRPARRKVQAVKLTCVAAAVALVLFVQLNIQREARAQAQHVAQVVGDWRAQHGSYPADLAQAGLDEASLRRQWRVRYVVQGDRHRVTYPNTFSVYDGWVWDCDRPGWVATAE